MSRVRNLSLPAYLFLLCAFTTCAPGAAGRAEPPAAAPAASEPTPIQGDPQLDVIEPDQGANSGGLLVTLSGQGFAGGATVLFDGVAATEVSVWSSTRITARLPAQPGRFGKVSVRVQNPEGRSASREDFFLYHGGLSLFPQPIFAEGRRTLVEVGDFNRDGKPDLVTDGVNTVEVALNSGRCGFLPTATFAVGTKPSGVAVADFNGDQKPDLAVTSAPPYAPKSVGVLFGDGTGGFSVLQSYSLTGQPGTVIVTDFNNDQKLDLALGQQGQILVLLGSDAGDFMSTTAWPISRAARSIAAEDLVGLCHFRRCVLCHPATSLDESSSGRSDSPARR
jgi:hypothetical protein